MTTQLLFVRDAAGYNTFIPSGRPNKIYDTTLSANVAQTFSVPSDDGKFLAIIANRGATVFYAINDTAAIPGNSVSETTSLQNPPGFIVNNGDTISAITADTTAYVTITFYSGVT